MISTNSLDALLLNTCDSSWPEKLEAIVVSSPPVLTGELGLFYRHAALSVTADHYARSCGDSLDADEDCLRIVHVQDHVCRPLARLVARLIRLSRGYTRVVVIAVSQVQGGHGRPRMNAVMRIKLGDASAFAIRRQPAMT